MSPRTADPAVRAALISTAAEVIASEGRGALSLRRLARDVGTSTMAIYTHFGSMDELIGAVRREGFARLRAALNKVDITDDPMADLSLLGAAYYETAVSEPNLYRSMFLESPINKEDFGTGLDTFLHLCAAIERCSDAGSFPKADPADPGEMAVEVWAIVHGLVTLQMAHLLPEEQVTARMASAYRSLFLGWGADPRQIEMSRQRAARRKGGSA